MSEFRTKLTTCSPDVLYEIHTNAAALAIDPKLCTAFAALVSSNQEARVSGAAWFAENGPEPAVLVMITNVVDSVSFEREGLAWLSSNASWRSVGVVLDIYERIVTDENGSFMNADSAGVLRETKGLCMQALRRAHGRDFDNAFGANRAEAPPDLEALALVQFSREKWLAAQASGLYRATWKDRKALFKLLNESAGRTTAGEARP